MVIRQSRMIALSLLATIVVLALWFLFWLGPDYPLVQGIGNKRGMSAREAAIVHVGYAAFWTVLFERAMRVRRWRRNVVRAGGVLMTSWIGVMVMVLAMQMMALADALGRPLDRQGAYAAVVAVLILVKANLLPKSRPAWFNGVALPLFAPDANVWRAVHRASAVRLALLGSATLLVALAGAGGIDPLAIVMRLLMMELVIASLHGIWLSRRQQPPPLLS